MQTYKISDAGLKQLRRRILLKYYLFLVNLFIIYYYFKDDSRVYSLWENIIISALVFITSFLIVYFTIKKSMSPFKSYLLQINDNSVTLEQLNMPKKIIAISEIKEIHKQSNGHIVIYGADKTKVIGIPPQIENYEEIEKKLNQIIPIQLIIETNFYKKHQSLISKIILLVAIGIIYFSNNKILVGLSGIFVISSLIYAFFKVQLDKNVGRKLKLVSWWFIFVAIMFGLSALFKVYPNIF
jgi:hypothetical protein